MPRRERNDSLRRFGIPPVLQGDGAGTTQTGVLRAGARWVALIPGSVQGGGFAGRGVVVRLLLPLLLLPGCRLEDRTADAEAGDLPAVEVGMPDERGARSAGEVDAPLPVVELGAPFWREGNTRAVEITARFVSPEARAAHLDPEAFVVEVEGVRWRLEELLVMTDLSRGATQARWQVAGPPPVIDRYLASLQDHPPDRSPLQEVGVLHLEPRPAPPGG